MTGPDYTNGFDLRHNPAPKQDDQAKETLELVRTLGELMLRMNKVLMLVVDQQAELVEHITGRRVKRD